MRATLTFLFFAVTFWACDSRERLVVFADPWAGDLTRELVADFEASHPEVEVRVRYLSSEVILQHLHFGDPIDIALLIDRTLPASFTNLPQPQEEVQLASLNLAQVRVKGGLNAGIPGAGGTMLEASDRPVRRLTDAWRSSQALPVLPDSLLVANFYSQVEDYLLGAWVRYGYTLEVLARRHSDRLEVLQSGPAVPGGLYAWKLTLGQDSAASAFMDLLRSEKCQRLLAEESFFP